MARSNPRIIFLYLLLPAIFIIFIYSFIFAKFSTVNPPYSRYQNYFYTNNNGNHSNERYIQTQQPFSTSNDESDTDSTNQTVSSKTISSPLSNPSKVVINLNQELHRLQTSRNHHHQYDIEIWSKSMEKRFQKEKATFPLKVIIIPHSHNDPGWLNTYDQYFYHYTYYILENMVKNLNKYPNMTFVWAEMSYFSRWWESQTSNRLKENLRKLLNEKRLEIVTGGWVMTDEAAAHYFDMIDQLIEGHQFLQTTFFKDHQHHHQQYSIRNSWSVDPFGHSTTFSYLLQKAGIKNIYIQRTHYLLKRYLSEKRYLDFFWKQPFQDGQQSSESYPMCHMSPLHLYSFKYACGPDFKVCLEFDFRKIYGEQSESTATALNQTNIDRKAQKIIKQYSKLGSLFPHNVALILLGDDFRYNFDIEWQQQYKNYMFLMDYINSNGDKFNQTEIVFGTLDDYFRTINERLPIEEEGNYPELEGDFIPYADSYADTIASYWTGYFTTRPYFKSLSRELQHWLRSTEIIYSLTRNYLRQQYGKSYHLNVLLDREYNIISNARQNLALFQHHDGITGTSKDYVMEDYGRRMSHSLNNTMYMFAKIIQYLNLDSDTLAADIDNNTEQFVFTTQTKSSWHLITEQQILNVPPGDQDGLHILVFNPHTRIRTESIKIFIDDPFVQILDIENNQRIPFQINPIFNNGSKISSNAFEVQFFDSLYPLSLKNYKILTNEEMINPKVTVYNTKNRMDHYYSEAFQFENEAKHFNLENDYLILTINQRGFLEKIHFKDKNRTEFLHMSFISYNSEPKRSGAYLLKFLHQNPYPELFFSQSPIVNLYKGNLSSTIMVNYTDIAYQITLYNVKSNIGSAIEMKLLIDLENKANYVNQEIAIRIKTNIFNRKQAKKSSNNTTYRTFYVDSNGFQMLERQFVESIGVEANYYPMTSAIFIEDHNWRLTVLSSHSHGATSSKDGNIEIMLDRRIILDDKRGLSEGVLDNVPVQSNFWLVFEESPASQQVSSSVPVLTELADSLLLYLNYPSITMFSYRSDMEITKDQSKQYYRNQYLISPNLLCKYFLVNLRTLPQYDSFTRPSQSSLMILHNRALHPSSNPITIFEEATNTCDHDYSSKFPMSTIHFFNEIRVASIQQTPLTGLNGQQLQKLTSLSFITSSSQLNVPLFHIESYNITFR